MPVCLSNPSIAGAELFLGFLFLSVAKHEYKVPTKALCLLTSLAVTPTFPVFPAPLHLAQYRPS